MKKIVLFDIDYTLFNAQRFRDLFFNELANRIASPQKKEVLLLLEQVYEQAKKETNFFDPKSFLRLLQKKLSFDDTELVSLEKTILKEEYLELSLYEETKEVIQTLAKQKDSILGIFSWGYKPVQKEKIKRIMRFFNKKHIHIFEFDKIQAVAELLKKYTNKDQIFIIDDYQEVLREAKKLNKNIVTIWIQRSETEGKRKSFSNFAPDSIIKNLSEVIPLINS